MRATIAKLYYKVKHIAKERGMDQSEIFIREKQYDFTTDSGLFTPPDTIRKVLNVIGILSEQMDHLWLFQNSIAFKLVKKMIHATTPPKKKIKIKKNKKDKKISHCFLEGKCHPLLYVTVALNLYANIYLHHHIKGLNISTAAASQRERAIRKFFTIGLV